MTFNRLPGLSRGLRTVVGLGVLAAAAAIPANADVHVGFSMHVDLPPGVHVTVGSYDPYYVGRVYYAPLAVWRPVYSFPVATPYGVVYQPYVYDGRNVVCHGYIPGPYAGYARFVVEGRGYYHPGWYRGHAVYRHPYPHRGR